MKSKRKSKKKKENISIDEMVMKTVDGQVITNFPSSVVEQLRHMVTHIQYTGGLPEQISLVSAIRGEGVTYVTWALASIIANDLQARVCAVELNWWFPANKMLPGEQGGIAAVLKREKDLDDVILKTNNKYFYFIPAGIAEPQQRAVFARSDNLKNLIQELHEKFDYVLIDVPAILSTSDAIPLASLGDSTCLVTRQGVTHIDNVQTALDDVAHLNVLGVVLNQVDLKTPSFILRMIPQN